MLNVDNGRPGGTEPCLLLIMLNVDNAVQAARKNLSTVLTISTGRIPAEQHPTVLTLVSPGSFPDLPEWGDIARMLSNLSCFMSDEPRDAEASVPLFPKRREKTLRRVSSHPGP